MTFDAFDRMVEQNRSGSYTQIVYSPTGAKLALGFQGLYLQTLRWNMDGQSLVKAFIPLPGQASAVYTNSGLDHYRHSDWLGSARLTSSPTQTYTSSVVYAPFGETYAQSGAADPAFTGQRQDTVSGLYDFPNRQYSIQGRWPVPDPSGLASMHLRDPQTLNRYAYVRNNPLALVDPQGLDEADQCGDDSGDCGDGGILGGGGGGGCTDPSCGSDNGSGNNPNNPDPSSGDPSNSGSDCAPSDTACGGSSGDPTNTDPNSADPNTPDPNQPNNNPSDPLDNLPLYNPNDTFVSLLTPPAGSGCSNEAQNVQAINSGADAAIDTFVTDLIWGEGGAAAVGCAVTAEVGCVPGAAAAASAALPVVFIGAIVHGTYEMFKPTVKLIIGDIKNHCP